MNQLCVSVCVAPLTGLKLEFSLKTFLTLMIVSLCQFVPTRAKSHPLMLLNFSCDCATSKIHVLSCSYCSFFLTSPPEQLLYERGVLVGLSVLESYRNFWLHSPDSDITSCGEERVSDAVTIQQVVCLPSLPTPLKWEYTWKIYEKFIQCVVRHVERLKFL